MGGAAGIEGD